MTEGLPNGWVSTQLGDVADVLRGVTYKKDQALSFARDGHVPLHRATNINNGNLDSDNLVYVPAACVKSDQMLRPGDIVIAASSGSLSTVGKGGYATSATVGTWGAFCTTVRPSRFVDAKFVYYFTQAESTRRRWSSLAAGTNINNLKRTDLLETPLLLPPLAEQQRIVAVLDDHFSRLDAAVKFATLVLRRSLALRDWVSAAGPVGGLSRVSRSAQPLASVGLNDGELPDLPDGWTWSRLGKVADVVGGVTKDSKKQGDLSFVEVPYLRVANVQRGRLDLTEIATIRVPPKKAAQLRLERGDVLLNEGGDRDKLGRGWIWEEQIDNCIHQNHVFRARIDTAQLHPKLAAWHANGFGKQWCDRNGKQSVNLASISLSKIKMLPIPIPPDPIQDALVDEIETYLAKFDHVIRMMQRILDGASNVRRALLINAFSGKLLPQHSDDEPASALLELIKAEQLAAKKPPRARRAASGRSALKSENNVPSGSKEALPL